MHRVVNFNCPCGRTVLQFRPETIAPPPLPVAPAEAFVLGMLVIVFAAVLAADGLD